MNIDSAALRTQIENAGQGHLLVHLDRLAGEQRRHLEAQLARLDFGLVAQLGALLGKPAGGTDVRLEPPETFPLERDGKAERRAAEARQAGAERLSSGRVAYLLVAGGQASRLGYDGPKGCFPVGPVSGRPLFDMHARRLLAAKRRHGARPLWYVMTSAANDATTRAFFLEHSHFGLAPEDVFFFSQEMLPALDNQGRILLAAPDALFLAPNGHGGVLDGMARSGALAHARERGVETLSYFQVDNPLARPADPLFLGLHHLAGASMSSKVVDKRAPGEKVGVLGRIDGRMGCIEYSDLSPAEREARGPDGKLRFRAGNIAVHAIELAFVDELTRGGLQLPYHLAAKKMRALDDSGREVEIAGTKFETFVFDALARSKESVVLEVERALEFSPVKNATGEDSPATTRADLCKLFSGWVKEAGLPLPPADADGSVPVEVDPLLAEDAAEFRAATPIAPETSGPGHLYAARG